MTLQPIRCPGCGLWPVISTNKVGPGGYSILEPNLCVSFRCYGFCPFGLDCGYDHPDEFSIHGTLELSVQALVAALHRVSERNKRDVYVCNICREKPRGPPSVIPVGETFHAPYCTACGNFYFQPYVQSLSLLLLKTSTNHYEVFKKSVDEASKLLPVEFQVPFMYESHRWATSRFSWSLFNSRNAQDVMTYLLGMVNEKRITKFRRILSVGAGRGYTEHLMKKSCPDGVEVLAFDRDSVDIPRAAKFSVPVRFGTPDTLLCYEDLKDTVLFLSWPPFGSQVNNESTMAHDALVNFEKKGGEVLVYVGDPTATGDWRYHEALLSRWDAEEKFSTSVDLWVPEKMGLIYAGNDQVRIYKKLATPRVIPPVQWVLQSK